MGLRLDWQMESNGRNGPEMQRQRLPTSSLTTILAVLLVAVLGLALWQTYRQQRESREAELKSQLQTILDLEHQAFLDGDGERLLANLTHDAGWRSAQLLPINQQAHRAGQTVTDITESGQEIWASVTWQAEAGAVQRVVFFERQGEVLLHAPGSALYWGGIHRTQLAWGELIYHEADQPFADAIGRHVAEILAEACPAACPAIQQGLSVRLASDYQPGLESHQVRLPSPRLIGLNGQGQPAAIFWEQLRRTVVAAVTLPVIRFVVPEELLSDYQSLAIEFMGQHPAVTVEIVSLAALPPDPRDWPSDIDGAAVTPTTEMLAAGLVLDLTAYAKQDAQFDPADFYDQIWQGAWWQERMWFVPQAASMKLLFYDRGAYRQAGLAEPSLRWTWDEMTADLGRLATALPGSEQEWAFLDPGPDILFAYVFDQAGRCPGPAGSGPCSGPPQPAAIAAALTWYQALAKQPAGMPNLTEISSAERLFQVINLVAPRKVAVWVEEPVLYELHMLRQPLGVVAFPGSERFDGVTPLWVQGNFISQYSRQPLVTWEWLNFLSHHALQRQKRYIPARPSVAADTGYWSLLPRPVGEAMRAAFPFARAVRLEEQQLFGWELLRLLLAGEISPNAAAQTGRPVRWFQSGQE
jgi:ABC-type glycerol-3-phosphate transport system substrate-binding protein